MENLKSIIQTEIDKTIVYISGLSAKSASNRTVIPEQIAQ